jgi:hypothetical protein
MISHGNVWECVAKLLCSLQSVLHLLSENLLMPGRYPNPFPKLRHLRKPIPPLPSHFPPHPIYTFCSALPALMMSIDPSGPQTEPEVESLERWALAQRVPSGQDAGEWFTSDVVASNGELTPLAAKGDQFGVFCRSCSPKATRVLSLSLRIAPHKLQLSPSAILSSGGRA